ncbi:MerR family transcriptional regulator [Companilactobacillus halodurans]|uniref:MerR family transcriptional regulator n=1 Tax=Companilactobacillus halodurans TaxID=2584183 RepID=A0A5P0ZU80_9LACO|nr:MerR family transcriptional regulator [Companilactobacillus halodurans]MQS76039.1 MerR family transcriptional regulator [Companilactobacillus halodurans]MQS96475.1 MerR family transcriptional regulator [Companilactobacillus halodurans]
MPIKSVPETGKYRISEFAEIVGLNSPTLRYYEKEGLIKPYRTKNGIRYYTQKDVSWVNFLMHLKSTGMTIEQLKRYVHLRAQGDSTINQRIELLEEVRKNFEVEYRRLQEGWTILNDKLDWYKDKAGGHIEDSESFSEYLKSLNHDYLEENTQKESES